MKFTIALFAIITEFWSALYVGRAFLTPYLTCLFANCDYIRICLWKENELRYRVSRGEVERKSDSTMEVQLDFVIDCLEEPHTWTLSPFSSFRTFCHEFNFIVAQIESKQPEEVFIWLMINRFVTFPWAACNCLLICQLITTCKWVIRAESSVSALHDATPRVKLDQRLRLRWRWLIWLVVRKETVMSRAQPVPLPDWHPQDHSNDSLLAIDRSILG